MASLPASRRALSIPGLDPREPVVQPRFRRSVDLGRDVLAPAALDGYVVTATARAALARLLDGLADPDAARAWSIVGPYGGGKSAFALFAARLLAGRPDALARLRAHADPGLVARAEAARARPLVAVVVSGSRERLPVALVRGLARAAAEADAPLAPLAAEARALLDALGARHVSDEAVAELFERALATAARAGHAGLLVVVDELGKLLEHGAATPEGGDLFLLQRLAERAARSGPGAPFGSAAEEDGRAPVLLVATILHQAFDRYASALAPGQRDEWRKVQGRFEDVAYAEPPAEALRQTKHPVRV